MQDTTILKGISTRGRNAFTIIIKDNSGTHIFGQAINEDEAKDIIKKIGIHDVDLLRKKTDEKRKKIFVEEKESSYKVSTQSLGTFRNGSIELEFEIYYEEVARVYSIIE